MSPGLASVVIPCWNQLEFTRQCIAALMRHTRGTPWEMTLIDNQRQTDGTRRIISPASAMRRPSPSALITTEYLQPGGFPAAVNQGLQRARGGYLVLLRLTMSS